MAGAREKLRLVRSWEAGTEHDLCWQGLWRGTVPGQLLAVPYTAVQFVALQQCRSFAHRNGLLAGERAWLLSFLSGAAAGTAATIASYPFDTLRTILAAQGKPPVSPPVAASGQAELHAHAAQPWLRSRDPHQHALTHMPPTTQRELSARLCHHTTNYSCVYLMPYGAMHWVYHQLWLCMQVYNGMLDAARGVISRQGFRGLYSGLSVTLVEIIPYAALQFGLYDLFTAAAARSHGTEVRSPPLCSASACLDTLAVCLHKCIWQAIKYSIVENGARPNTGNPRHSQAKTD